LELPVHEADPADESAAADQPTSSEVSHTHYCGRFHKHSSYINSLQNRKAIPWAVLTLVDGVTLLASAVFLAVVVLVRRGALVGDAGRLLELITWAYLVNAGLMGALSGIADRYAARLAWLVPLFAMALLLSGRTDLKKLNWVSGPLP
jgi:hypothetical protein